MRHSYHVRFNFFPPILVLLFTLSFKYKLPVIRDFVVPYELGKRSLKSNAIQFFPSTLPHILCFTSYGILFKNLLPLNFKLNTFF